MTNPTKSVHGCPVDCYSVYSYDGETIYLQPTESMSAPRIEVASSVDIGRDMTAEQIRQAGRDISKAIPGYLLSCRRDQMRDPSRLYVEIARNPEISREETYSVNRARNGLIPDGVHLSNPFTLVDYTVVIPCQIKTRYEGTATGDDVAGNVEHGKVRVTLADGRVFAGEFSWNGDARCSDSISNLTPIEVAQPV